MQAQEQRMMRWAVIMRTKNPSHQRFADDFNAGRIVRTHLFRCTWQLVCAGDLHWMLSLCGERNRNVVKGWMKTYRRRLPAQSAYAEARQAIRSILQGCRITTRIELLKRMSALGIEGDERQLSIHLYLAEADGTICSGQLHPSKVTYALVDEICPDPKVLSREKALAELATRYFQSHSPATLEDFVWWTGLPKSDCLKAIQGIAKNLTELKVHGTTLYLHKNCRTRGCRESYILLPSYDEYLIGYKSRQYALDEAHSHHAHNKIGVFYPVILHRGEVVGNWLPKQQTTSFFTPNEESDMRDAFIKYERAMNR